MPSKICWILVLIVYNIIVVILTVFLRDFLIEVIQYNSVSVGSDYGNVFRLIGCADPHEYALRVQIYHHSGVGRPSV